MKTKKQRFIICCCLSTMLLVGDCQIVRGEENTTQESVAAELELTEGSTTEEAGESNSQESSEIETSEADSEETLEETSKSSDGETKESLDHESSISGNQPPEPKEEMPLDPSEIASGSDAEEKTASKSDAEKKIASASDAETPKPANPVFHVTIPVGLPFRIDLFEINERGQIYSDEYVFQNLGDKAVKVNINQMYCEFTEPEEYHAVSTLSEINPESELKDLYLFLARQGEVDNESPGIVVTDQPQESTAYSFILPSAQESEHNKITFRMTGAVNESSDYEWRSGEVKVVMAVSFEEIKSVEETVTEETLINDLLETSDSDPKETLEQDSTEEKNMDDAVSGDQKPPADKPTEAPKVETTMEESTAKEETTAREESTAKEETVAREESTTKEETIAKKEATVF